MKGQDIVIALKLLVPDSTQSYANLGESVGLSASEAHAAVRRLVEARLIEPDSRHVLRQPLLRFLIHGLPFVFPASLREGTRGVPTAWAAPVLANQIQSNEAPRFGPIRKGRCAVSP